MDSPSSAMGPASLGPLKRHRTAFDATGVLNCACKNRVTYDGVDRPNGGLSSRGSSNRRGRGLAAAASLGRANRAAADRLRNGIAYQRAGSRHGPLRIKSEQVPAGHARGETLLIGESRTFHTAGTRLSAGPYPDPSKGTGQLTATAVGYGIRPQSFPPTPDRTGGRHGGFRQRSPAGERGSNGCAARPPSEGTVSHRASAAAHRSRRPAG